MKTSSFTKLLFGQFCPLEKLHFLAHSPELVFFCSTPILVLGNGLFCLQRKEMPNGQFYGENSFSIFFFIRTEKEAIERSVLLRKSKFKHPIISNEKKDTNCFLSPRTHTHTHNRALKMARAALPLYHHSPHSIISTGIFSEFYTAIQRRITWN